MKVFKVPFKKAMEEEGIKIEKYGKISPFVVCSCFTKFFKAQGHFKIAFCENTV